MFCQATKRRDVGRTEAVRVQKPMFRGLLTDERDEAEAVATVANFTEWGVVKLKSLPLADRFTL